MNTQTFLLGMSKDASVGFLMGFGLGVFACLSIIWVDSAIKHFRRNRGR